MRTILKCSIRFGRIGIPVGLAPTTSGGDIALRTVHRECGTPVTLKRWCALHERLVDDTELAKAWELAPGQLLLLEPEEVAALVLEPSRSIELAGFVDAGELDPLLVERTYYLAPSEQPAGRRPYALLSDTLAQTDTVALGRFVAWGSEKLCAIQPLGGGGRALLLQTLRFAEDLVSADELEDALAEAELIEEELDLARQLAQRLRVPIARVDLASTERGRVKALLEDKLAGKQIVEPDRPPAEPVELPSLDLRDALKRSIREAPRKRGRAPKTTV
jgi:DNA end-binding protein Ku